MNYLDVREISKNWNIPERKVTALCRDGRIIGAKKSGKSWLIPDDAVRPLDGRIQGDGGVD